MAENGRRLSLTLPWSTLLKVIAAVALVAVLLHIWYILTLILIAIIVAIGLYPAVRSLEARGWSRSMSATVVVLAMFALIVGFFAVMWSSMMGQARAVITHVEQRMHELAARLPEPIARVIQQWSGPNTSAVASWAFWVGESFLTAAAAFVLASIL